jgi:hypothetical protein
LAHPIDNLLENQGNREQKRFFHHLALVSIIMLVGTIPAFCGGVYEATRTAVMEKESLKEWLTAEADPQEFKNFLDKHIYSVPDFDAYLALKGGEMRMAKLREEEFLGMEEN